MESHFFLTIPLIIISISNDSDRQFMMDLFSNYQALMYQTAYQIIGEHQDSEDMVQETCIALINHLEEIRKIDASKLFSYIMSVTRNLSINYVVKRNRRNKYSFLSDNVASINPEIGITDVDSGLIREAEIEILKRALRQLSEKERLILEMKYYDGKTNSEIAEVLEIKAASVRSYLTKARRRLMERIDEENRKTSEG